MRTGVEQAAVKITTRDDAQRTEAGFLWAIKVADVWACRDPLWADLNREAMKIQSDWWQTVPKTQLIRCIKSSNVWVEGHLTVARKAELPGWYLIDGFTDRGFDFEFSAPESRLL